MCLEYNISSIINYKIIYLQYLLFITKIKLFKKYFI